MTEPGAMTKTLNIRMDPTMFLRLQASDQRLRQRHSFPFRRGDRRPIWDVPLPASDPSLHHLPGGEKNILLRSSVLMDGRRPS